MAEWRAFRAGEQEAEFRQFMAYFFEQTGSLGQVKPGVLPGSSLKRLLTEQTTTASASVQVTWGAAVVQDVRTDGVTPLVANSTKTIDVLGANPMGSLPRNDLVVFDAVVGQIVLVVGIPNAAPTDPTPANAHLKLARLRHAANATTVPNSKIDDLRVFTSLNTALNSTSDSGWVDMSVAGGKAGQGGSAPQVRKIGTQVFARWGWAGTGLTTPGGAIVAGTVPAGYRPARATYVNMVGSTGNQYAMATVDPSGAVTIRIGSNPLDYYLFPGETTGWFTD